MHRPCRVNRPQGAPCNLKLFSGLKMSRWRGRRSGLRNVQLHPPLPVLLSLTMVNEHCSVVLCHNSYYSSEYVDSLACQFVSYSTNNTAKCFALHMSKIGCNFPAPCIPPAPANVETQNEYVYTKLQVVSCKLSLLLLTSAFVTSYLLLPYPE